MTKSDYILVTGSRNLDDGTSDSDTNIPEEKESDSLSALEQQGVSIIETTERTAKGEPRDQLYRELMNEGGIEIIETEEEDTLL